MHDGEIPHHAEPEPDHRQCRRPTSSAEIEAHRAPSTALSARGRRLRRNSMACVALPTCGLALAESERYLPDLIDALDERLAAHGLADDDIVIRMTGCPNGCARPYIAEIGLVGKGPGPLQSLSRRRLRRLAHEQALCRGSRPRRHRRGARSDLRRLCRGPRRRASASATSPSAPALSRRPSTASTSTPMCGAAGAAMRNACSAPCSAAQIFDRWPPNCAADALAGRID